MTTETKRNKITRLFLLFAVIVITFYLLVPYYLIYCRDLKEKKVIADLRQSNFSDEILKHANNNHISYYKNSFDEGNIKEKSPDSQKKDSDNNIPDENQTSKVSQSEWIGDCILIIPDISLEKIVYTGNNREQHLENYELITASPDMKYINGGNYIICGHASRLYGHSLNRLKEVKKGTKIQIQTKDKTDEYIINKVTYENMNQTSQYCKQTIENTVTIISCAKYISKESYIVIYAEKK